MQKMRKPNLPLSLILVASMMVLIGCKGDEPVAEANQPKAQQPKQTVTAPQAEKAAIECAQTWLALADAEKYAESWDQAAEIFRAAVTKEQWEKALQGLRKPLGKMRSRKLKSKKYTKTAPGAPDGQYVIIQYQTSFERKTVAIETVTPMLDKDGKWRVSGYYIK